MRIRPARAASVTSASASGTVVASGFSQKTSTPASSSVRTTAWWVCFGVRTSAAVGARGGQQGLE